MASKASQQQLDLTVVKIIPNRNYDPLFSLHGTSLIFDALSADFGHIVPTACTLFHRFVSNKKKEEEVWSTAMACVLVAGKMHEDRTLTVRWIIPTFVRLYVERVSHSGDAQFVVHFPVQRTPTITPYGPIWQAWQDAVLEREATLLRSTGFVLHWVVAAAPHRYLPVALAAAAMDVHEAAWKYVTDSCRLPPVAEPVVVATAAVYVSVLEAKTLDRDTNNKSTPPDWWRTVLASEFPNDDRCDRIVAQTANALLRTRYSQREAFRVACRHFLVWPDENASSSSLEKPQTFNSPGSFVWEALIAQSLS